MATNRTNPIAKSRKEYKAAVKAVESGDLEEVVKQLLIAEINTQAQANGVGQESFRRMEFVFRLIGEVKSFTVAELTGAPSANDLELAWLGLTKE